LFLIVVALVRYSANFVDDRLADIDEDAVIIRATPGDQAR
jgi:hypothetical protein